MVDWREEVYHRNRADMLRTVAKVQINREHRRILSETARYFDGLADSLEREAQSRGAKNEA